MDTSIVLIIGAISIGLIVILSIITIANGTRVSVPGYPLWPPQYFYPDRRRQGASDGPPTGAFRIPSGHSGIPVTDSTNAATPPNWRQPAEIDPNATQAYLIAPELEQHSGIPVTDETNRNRAPQTGPQPKSNADAWFEDHDTNKKPGKMSSKPRNS